MNINEIKNEKIVEKFKNLKNEAEIDCRINKEDLLNDIKTSELLVKWLNKRVDWVKLYNQIELERKKIYRNLYEYYNLEYQLKIDTKEQLNLMISTDENYIDINNKVILIKEIIEYIENVIEILKQKSWDIKNFIDYLKWTNGHI